MVGVALVGTGAFALEHVSSLQKIPGVQITHVVGSDPARTAAFARQVPGAVASTELGSVLEDPAVNAVDICNRTADHAPAAIAAARAGRHVHVDKPAALSLTDFDAMTAAADAAGVSLMVGQTVRFQPIISRLQAAVARCEIGKGRLLHTTWYTGHAWPHGWRGWQYDVEQSGGHPVHNGTHILDLAVWLLDSHPVEVFARGLNTWAADMPIPDSFSMVVRFADGSLATLELCYALQQRGEFIRRIVLVGEDGTLRHDTGDDPGLVSGAAKAPPASLEGALDIQLAHWIGVVRGEEELVVRPAQARAALATALAAQRSLVSGQPERVAEGAVL